MAQSVAQASFAAPCQAPARRPSGAKASIVGPLRAPVSGARFAAKRAPVLRLPAATRSVVRAAAAEQEASSTSSAAQGPYLGLVASADFFFNDVQNEAFAEQLRERVRFFGEQDREIDFFFVPEPAWLEAKVPGANRVGRPSVALVSTDKVWMDFMKLRLDRVLRADLSGMSDEEIFASSSNYAKITFDKPLGSTKWTAPYTPYEQGWWEPFYNKQ